MYGIPPPPGGPSEGGGAGSGSNARYAFLVARLRNRQITMEEATELFGIMQETLARTMARAPTAAAVPPPATRAVAPAGAGAPALPALTDETFTLSLIALGAGAGLLSAVLKRSTEGPRNSRPA